MNRLSNLIRLGLAVYSSAALVSLAPLQQATAGNDSPSVHITQVDESQFPKIKVYVSVTDTNGEPLGVAPERLRLAENGAEVKPDQISGKGEIGPLTTLLIMDVSGSMNEAGKLKAAQIAARTYVDQMRAGDQAGLLAFNTEIDYVQPVTADRAALANAIDSLKAKNDTVMYDALAKGVQILDSIPGRKAVIVLTDGLDNRSTHSVDQVFEQIGPGGLSISTIGLGDPSQLGVSNAALDEAALKSLAERAGGNYGYAEDPETLRNLYERFGRALQSEYVLTYNSPTALRDGVKRTLSVSLARAGTPAEANYNPGGVVPEVPRRATTWMIFGVMLAGLLVLLFGPVLFRQALIATEGQPSIGDKLKRKGSHVRLHDQSSPAQPRIRVR